MDPNNGLIPYNVAPGLVPCYMGGLITYLAHCGNFKTAPIRYMYLHFVSRLYTLSIYVILLQRIWPIFVSKIYEFYDSHILYNFFLISLSIMQLKWPAEFYILCSFVENVHPFHLHDQ